MSSYQEKYPSDWTPLHIAVWRHDFVNTRSLANSGSVNREDDQGWTPVHLACASEDSMIFHSHQVSKRRREGSFSNLGPRNQKPPRGKFYSILDDNERAAAMGILDILLENKPPLNKRVFGNHQSLFPTPLHCAANSGWFSHARALVGAGAAVYTGPDCSPLCWAKGGSRGDQPVAVYLRETLGERGLSMIEAEHARLQRGQGGAGNESEPFQPSNMGERALPQLTSRTSPGRKMELLGTPAEDFFDEPLLNVAQEFEKNFEVALGVERVLPHPEQKHEGIDSNGLCQACAGISFKALCRPKGYFNPLSVNQLQQSARRCTFCKIIYEVLSEDRILSHHEGSQIIIRISNGTKHHRGTCTDPLILRTLEFKISAGCTCITRKIPIEPLDFSECYGTCEGIEVLVSIFSENETKVTIPMEFDLDNDTTYDASWSIQEGIQIDSDPLSPVSVKIIQKWLVNCSTNHQHYKRDDDSKDSQGSVAATQDVPLPTRLIDVDSADVTSIRLCKGTGEHGKYIALSHRWVSGPTPQWVTTHDTVESRYNWFPIDNLPASIADAVRVTRKLGLQYLWVDSICIIQDSLEDWEVESSRMASIYANAHLTLFADCGRDDDHGFLFPRDTFPSNPVTLPTQDGNSVKLNLRKSSRTSFKTVQSSLFPANVETSYLSQRGWIFQERVLSRRILHFGKDQMFWECNDGTFAEDGHIVLKKGQRECGQCEAPLSKLAYTRVLGDPTRLSQESFASQWERLINAYSPLSLTRGEDKLPALSGLAAAFHSRTENDEYVAGIWLQSLPKQLAWSITNKKPEKVHKFFQARDYGDGSYGGDMQTDDSFIHSSQLFHRPRTYQAPTFSWAAVKGEIEFHELPKPGARVKSITLDIPTQNPYGSLKHGHLTISGSFRQAWSCGPLTQDMGGWLCQRKEGYVPLYNGGWPFGYMLPDSKDDLDVQDVYCFKLGETLYPRSIFLVLLAIPVQEADADILQFRRIGLGKTLDGETGFFTEAEVKTIQILIPSAD